MVIRPARRPAGRGIDGEDRAASTDVGESEELGEQGVAVVTLLARMTGAGISEDRARGHITRGVVRVAGEPVTDPELALPWTVRWVVGPE